VGGLRITDPNDFEISNINRQFGASLDSLGRNKSEVIYESLKSINSEANIEFSKKGIVNREEIREILTGCRVVIDAMDYGMFKESILLQRTAREMGIYYLFSGAIAFGALTVVFAPGGITLEEYNGLAVIDDPGKLEGSSIPMENVLPVLPTYIKDRSMLADIYTGKIPVPATSIGAGLAAIMAASETVNIIIGRDTPVAPDYTYIDLVDRRIIVGMGNQSAVKNTSLAG
jgi:molybdopterin/thiamine biosynthesis adenylyltransferase